MTEITSYGITKDRNKQSNTRGEKSIIGKLMEDRKVATLVTGVQLDAEPNKKGIIDGPDHRKDRNLEKIGPKTLIVLEALNRGGTWSMESINSYMKNSLHSQQDDVNPKVLPDGVNEEPTDNRVCEIGMVVKTHVTTRKIPELTNARMTMKLPPKFIFKGKR